MDGDSPTHLERRDGRSSMGDYLSRGLCEYISIIEECVSSLS